MDDNASIKIYVLLFGLISVFTQADVDVALSKSATQLNTFNNDNYTNGAHNAVDGNKDTCSYVFVSSSPPAWWQVDLGGMYNVSSVQLTNVASSNKYFLAYEFNRNFIVIVRSSNYTEDPSNDPSNLCYDYQHDNDPDPPAGSPIMLNCTNPIVGQYVTVRRHGSNSPGNLPICDFKVYTTLISSTTRPTPSSPQSPTFTTTTTTAPSNAPAARESSPSANSSLSSNPSSSPSSNNTPIIIGVIVGCFGLLVVIAVTVFLVIRFKHMRKAELCKESVGTPIGIISIPNTVVRRDELAAYIKRKKSQHGGFGEEFKILPKDDMDAPTVAKLPGNSAKNRFQNILPYNDSLVHLQIEEGDNPADTYINASYIRGYNNAEKMYVATQGPKTNTLSDFWRLVWQHNITTIVMITPLVENNKKKCEMYWPEKLQETKAFNRISVTLAVEEVYADYVHRELVLHNNKHGDSSDRKIVRQLHFTSWADKSRPEHCFPLLAFQQRVRTIRDIISSGPILVHCSAGVGRTGTFIAIDYLLDQIKHEQELSVFECVKALRLQRMNMVQVTEQYEFVYESVLEGATIGNTGIQCSNFGSKYEELSRKGSSGSGLEKQFKLLNQKRETKVGRASAGLKDKNVSKNRNKNIVAFDDCRPFLMTRETMKSDYINAAYVNGYRSKDAYLLTQVPLPNTLVDFWALIWDHNLQTTVLLQDLNGVDETHPIYWPEKSTTETYGPFRIEVTSTNKESPIWVRQFSVVNTKDKSAEPLTVVQYQLTSSVWPSGNLVPSQRAALSQLIKILTKNKNKILLQCSDGASRSGLMAAAMYLTDMMKVEQVVDVFRACRYVLVNRPHGIDSLDQYKFLHELALACIQEHDEYDYSHPSSPDGLYANSPTISETNDQTPLYANSPSSSTSPIKTNVYANCN